MRMGVEGVWLGLDIIVAEVDAVADGGTVVATLLVGR